MEKYNHPDIFSLMKENENKFCFDCGIAQPKWASVNNSVFVCLNCAGVHRGLGVNFSFIRSLTMDNWDEKQIRFLKNGGNKKMKEFMNEYNIPMQTDIELKYKLVALDYYRQNLRADILGDQTLKLNLVKPDLVTGIEKINEIIKSEKIIDNSNFISNDSTQFNTPLPKKSGFFNKIGNFFNKTADEIGSKMKDYKIQEKLDKTANFFDKKTKQVMKSQIVQKIVDKTKNVFSNKQKNIDNEHPNIEMENNFNNDNQIEENYYYENNQENTNNDQNIEDFFTKYNIKNTNVENNSKDNHNSIQNINPDSVNLIDYPTFNEINYQNNNKDINEFFK